MPFTFTVTKPTDIKKAFSVLEEKIKKHGGTLRGDEKSGYILSNGVEGSYTVMADCIEITVIKKPALLSKSVVEKYVSKEFDNASRF